MWSLEVLIGMFTTVPSGEGEGMSGVGEAGWVGGQAVVYYNKIHYDLQ